MKKSYKNDKNVAMKATWSDSEDSDSNHEEKKEITNLCFIALEENYEVKSKSNEHDELSYDDMYDEMICLTLPKDIRTSKRSLFFYQKKMIC